MTASPGNDLEGLPGGGGGVRGGWRVSPPWSGGSRPCERVNVPRRSRGRPRVPLTGSRVVSMAREGGAAFVTALARGLAAAVSGEAKVTFHTAVLEGPAPRPGARRGGGGAGPASRGGMRVGVWPAGLVLLPCTLCSGLGAQAGRTGAPPRGAGEDCSTPLADPRPCLVQGQGQGRGSSPPCTLLCRGTRCCPHCHRELCASPCACSPGWVSGAPWSSLGALDVLRRTAAHSWV